MLGANAILGVSVACARTGAASAVIVLETFSHCKGSKILGIS